MQHKTMFIDAPIIKVRVGGIKYPEVDGLQFSKNIEAAILEKEMEGFELFSMNTVNCAKPKDGITDHGFTSGIILTFKKENK